MAKCYIRKTLSGWTPPIDDALAVHKRQKIGGTYRADVVEPRNYKHHKLFFALLQMTFENQEQHKDFWSFRTAVALKAGHVRACVTLDGEIVLIPLRYSYDDLPDEGDFTVEFGKAMRICADILRMNDLEELEAEVARYAENH